MLGVRPRAVGAVGTHVGARRRPTCVRSARRCSGSCTCTTSRDPRPRAHYDDPDAVCAQDMPSRSACGRTSTSRPGSIRARAQSRAEGAALVAAHPYSPGELLVVATPRHAAFGAPAELAELVDRFELFNRSRCSRGSRARATRRVASRGLPPARAPRDLEDAAPVPEGRAVGRRVPRGSRRPAYLRAAGASSSRRGVVGAGGRRRRPAAPAPAAPTQAVRDRDLAFRARRRMSGGSDRARVPGRTASGADCRPSLSRRRWRVAIGAQVGARVSTRVHRRGNRALLAAGPRARPIQARVRRSDRVRHAGCDASVNSRNSPVTR